MPGPSDRIRPEPRLGLLRRPLRLSPVGGRRLRGDVASITVYPGVGPSAADLPLGAMLRQGYAEGLRDGRRGR